MRTINRHVRLLLQFYVAPPFTNRGWGVEEEAARGSRSGQAWRGGDRTEGTGKACPAAPRHRAAPAVEFSSTRAVW